MKETDLPKGKKLWNSHQDEWILRDWQAGRLHLHTEDFSCLGEKHLSKIQQAYPLLSHFNLKGIEYVHKD